MQQPSGGATTGAARRIVPVLAWVLAGAVVVLLAVAVWAARAPGGVEPAALLGGAVGLVLLAVVGAAIVARRPGNGVGWVMLGAGLCFALQDASHAWVAAALAGWDVPGVVAAAWLASWVWSPGWSLAFGWLPFLFPDGRVPTRRWRWLGVLLLVVSLQVVPTMLLPELEYGAENEVYGPNPIGLPAHGPLLEALNDVPEMLSIPVWCAIIVMQVLRYRRAETVERMQLRWFLFAIVLGLGAMTLTAIPVVATLLGDVSFSIATSVIAISVGIAVTRYRLYEIDRVVSRTVAYVLLAVVLTGVYLGGVLGLGAVARALTGESGDLVVALSTLAVAAAFQPVRRRVQHVVDRRFNRARYDAAGVVERFGRDLRDEVSLAAAVGGLRRVAAETVHPSSASVVLLAGEP